MTLYGRWNDIKTLERRRNNVFYDVVCRLGRVKNLFWKRLLSFEIQILIHKIFLCSKRVSNFPMTFDVFFEQISKRAKNKVAQTVWSNVKEKRTTYTTLKALIKLSSDDCNSLCDFPSFDSWKRKIQSLRLKSMNSINNYCFIIPFHYRRTPQVGNNPYHWLIGYFWWPIKTKYCDKLNIYNMQLIFLSWRKKYFFSFISITTKGISRLKFLKKTKAHCKHIRRLKNKKINNK